MLRQRDVKWVLPSNQPSNQPSGGMTTAWRTLVYFTIFAISFSVKIDHTNSNIEEQVFSCEHAICKLNAIRFRLKRTGREKCQERSVPFVPWTKFVRKAISGHFEIKMLLQKYWKQLSLLASVLRIYKEMRSWCFLRKNWILNNPFTVLEKRLFWSAFIEKNR